jgi:hypothetical protein
VTLDRWLSGHPLAENLLLAALAAAVFSSAYWFWMWACALPFG